eukprot:2861561-Prymnesium_polylepis.2
MLAPIELLREVLRHDELRPSVGEAHLGVLPLVVGGRARRLPAHVRRVGPGEVVFVALLVDRRYPARRQPGHGAALLRAAAALLTWLRRFKVVRLWLCRGWVVRGLLLSEAHDDAAAAVDEARPVRGAASLGRVLPLGHDDDLIADEHHLPY